MTVVKATNKYLTIQKSDIAGKIVLYLVFQAVKFPARKADTLIGTDMEQNSDGTSYLQYF